MKNASEPTRVNIYSHTVTKVPLLVASRIVAVKEKQAQQYIAVCSSQIVAVYTLKNKSKTKNMVLTGPQKILGFILLDTNN